MTEEQQWEHIEQACRYGKEFGYIHGREARVHRAYLGKPIVPLSSSKSKPKGGGIWQDIVNFFIPVYTSSSSSSSSSTSKHTTVKRPLTLFVYRDNPDKFFFYLDTQNNGTQNEIRKEFRSCMQRVAQERSLSPEESIRVDAKIYDA